MLDRAEVLPAVAESLVFVLELTEEALGTVTFTLLVFGTAPLLLSLRIAEGLAFLTGTTPLLVLTLREESGRMVWAVPGRFMTTDGGRGTVGSIGATGSVVVVAVLNADEALKRRLGWRE